jgi:hypothetical protein
MASVADFAAEFARRAAAGQKSSVYVSKKHVESFLLVLAREGFLFAKEALDEISDPEMRKIVETIFFSTVAGAGAGALIGGVVAGPPGAQVGAAVGAGLGFAAGCIAITITAKQEGDGLQFSLA